MPQLSEEHRAKLDGIVQQMAANGEPDDAIKFVVEDFKSKYAAPEHPQVTTQQLAAGGPSAMGATGEGARSVLKLAKENPGQAGALIAGAAAAPFTGGMSMLPAMGAEAAIGAGGAIAGHGIKSAATGEASSLGDVASDALTQGAMGAFGPVAGKMLTIAGKGLYRAAALPINKLMKYGDLIEQGLENAVPVSKGGLAKAEGLAEQAGAAKAKALDAADQKVALRMKSITADAGAKLGGRNAKLADAGADDLTDVFDKKFQNIETRNPYAVPSKVDQIKGTIDDQLGLAYRKLRAKEPLTPDEMFNMETSQAMSRANEEVVPGYKQLNRDKMNAEGLRQMISRRINPTSSGGNQGLENALTMLGGIAAIPARLAMLPQTLSNAGIAAFKTGKFAPQIVPTGLRAALIAALSGSQDQGQ